MAHGKLLNKVEKLIEREKELLGYIDVKVDEIEKHHYKYTFLRSGVAVIGVAAGIAGAVFTGGMSLLLAASATGAVASAGINRIDVNHREIFIRGVQEMIKVQHLIAIDVVDTMEDYFKDKEESIPKIYSCRAGHAIKSLHEVNKRQVIQLSRDSTVTGIMEFTRQKVKELEINVQNYPSDGELKDMFLGAIQAIGSILDIGLKMSRWATEVPTLDGIKETRESLKECIRALESFKQWFRSYHG